MLPLLVLLGTIAGAWYLLIVRPQKEQQTRHGRLVERLQVGDHVLTVGGIYGRVVAIEPATVVLELAPGLTSRMATDGIARIVHGAEAALPVHAPDVDAPSSTPPRQALEHDMQKHPDQHQQHPQQAAPHASAFPAPTLPPQPFAGAQVMAQPAHQGAGTSVAPPEPVGHSAMHAQYHAAGHVAPPASLPAPPPPASTTLRAQVLPALPSFEPRPWGDLAPTHAQHPVAPQQVAMPPAPPAPGHYIAAPMQPAAAMPVHMPFAQPQPAPHHHHPQPVHGGHASAPALQPAHQPPHHAMPAMPQHAGWQQPTHPQPHHQAALPHAPQLAHAVPVHSLQPAHAPQPHPVPQPTVVQPALQAIAAPDHAGPQADVDERRHSRAPKGMGSSLRLDDPSLRDTIARARSERAELAEEYRKLTAPLVDAAPAQGSSVHATDAPPAQHVGHDVNGQPLFATPGAPGVQPIAQYPAPVHVPAEGASTVPRPAVGMPIGGVDAAFQRRAPYSPAQAHGPAGAHVPAVEHATA